jgi:hypothetical protein
MLNKDGYQVTNLFVIFPTFWCRDQDRGVNEPRMWCKYCFVVCCARITVDERIGVNGKILN